MRFVVVCLDCEDIGDMEEDELIDGNYCPKCGRSNLCGFEVEE